MVLPFKRQAEPSLQQALSQLLAAQQFSQMSCDVLTEADPEKLSHYAAVVVMNAIGEQQKRLAALFVAIKVLPRSITLRIQ